jgi:dTDP-glucose pyrophosphorylase
MTIIFPMAGLSSRFTKAGYTKPKYMLSINQKSVFYHAVNSFKNYISKAEFIFIYRDILNTKEFILNECKKLGIKKFKLIKLENETEGQAHTVYLGLEKAKIADDENILIFNIDTFRPNFLLPKELDFNHIDGYLEVFEAEGDHWSFVLAEEGTNKAIKTAEKERISSLCSSGLYYFKQALDFKRIFLKKFNINDRVKNEFYIAPMYNDLVQEGKDIRFSKITLDEIIFCGTPDEYLKLLKNKSLLLL